MIRGFNHVGIAVKNLGKAILFFEKAYGVRLIWRASYGEQGFETALVGNGPLRFELLAGTRPDSFIAKFIADRGEGMHHVSLEVDEFDLVVEGLRAKGLDVIGETETEEFKAAFIHPKGNLGALTEIIEPKGGWGT